MRYAKVKLDDIANAPGLAVSVYVQGCPHHCKGCFNPETWPFDGGKEFTQETLDFIMQGLHLHGLPHTLCILGGEPLCPNNLELTTLLVTEVSNKMPEVDIYVWTGYRIEELRERNDIRTNYILNNIHCLIDGPFIQEERDITLAMRGSRNQRVLYL